MRHLIGWRGLKARRTAAWRVGRVEIAEGSAMPAEPDQGGFALMLTLALILLTSLTTAALLGLVLVTMKVGDATESAARETRAADGAIEAAIQTMRFDPDACVEGTQQIVNGVEFKQSTPSTADDVTASVDCEPAGGAAGSTDRVRIVGANGYKGAVKWAVDCPTAADVPPSCTPWSRVLGSVPAGLAGSKPGLVHTGPESLRFASGVTVRTGAATLGSPPADPDAAKPGLDVSGQYAQGSLGLNGVAGTNPCGLLAAAGAGAVVDSDNSPKCDDANARAVADDPTEAEADAGIVAPLAPGVVPATCSGTVIKFEPGTYDGPATAQLSKLMDGVSIPSCRDKTFYFAPAADGSPAVYSFDGPALKFGDPGSFYVFGEPLGWNAAGPGAGVAGTAPSTDPNASLCNPYASGATLLLSARTTIQHTAGRVSICPAFVDLADPYPAIYQTTSVPSKMTLTPASGQNTKLFYCDIWNDYIDPWTGECTDTVAWGFKIEAHGNEPLKSLKFIESGTEGNTTQNNLVNRRSTDIHVKDGTSFVCTTGLINGIPNGDRSLGYDVMSSANPGTCKSVLKTKTPQDLNGLSIYAEHKMVLGNSAVQQFLTVTGARIQVNDMVGTIDPSKATSPTNNWTGLGNIGSRDLDPLPASSAMAEPIMPCDKAACKTTLPTPDENPYVKDHTDRYEIDMGKFSFAAALMQPYEDAGVEPKLSSLNLVVDLATGQKPLPDPLRLPWPQGLGLKNNNFRADMETSLELTTPDGTRCTVGKGGVNGGSATATQQVVFDLMSVDNLKPDGSCNHDITSFSELTDPATTLKLVIDMPCVRNPDTPFLCFQVGNLDWNLWHDHIWKVRPPSIDRVAVSAATESYIGGPPNSQVAVNALASGGAGFRVMGKTWMPGTDFDIHWKGQAGTVPIFSHDLVLHGLGSDMAPDAATAFVCCSKPDSRKVRLIASANGRVRLGASVEFIDVKTIDNPDGTKTLIYAPGTAINVLDWSRCGLAGCASVLGTNAINPLGGG